MTLKRFFYLINYLLVVIMISAAVLVLYYEEFMGYLFFGILFSAILSNCGNYLSLYCDREQFYIARFVWCFLAISILACILLLPSSSDKPDANIAMSYPMLFLSFPLGMEGSLVFSGFIYESIENFYFQTFCDWFSFFSWGMCSGLSCFLGR